MLCVPPERITSALAAADHLVGLADRLGAGGAGRQAVGVEPLGAEDVGQVRGRSSGLLFRLGDRMELVPPQPGELGSRDLSAMRRLVHKLDEPGKILLALAGAQVDAEPGAVQGGPGLEQARILHGHLCRGQGELGVPRMIGPPARVVAIAVEPEVLDLGGDPRRERACIKERDRPDAALTFEERGPC